MTATASRFDPPAPPAVGASVPLRTPSRLEAGALPLLLTIVLVQGLLGCWAAFGILPQPFRSPGALTSLGKALYFPDRDMPLYAAGALACMVLGALLDVWMRRQPARADSAIGARKTLLVAMLAIAANLLPALLHDAVVGYFLVFAAGVGAFAWRAGAWLAASRGGAPGPSAGSVPHGIADPTPMAPLVAAPVRTPSRPIARRLGALLLDSAFPLALLALLVFVPSPEGILWRCYADDHFHHFDFYAVGPALAWQHGLRLGADFYTQYGVGWPVVLAVLTSAAHALNYSNFIRIEVAAGCLYFLVLFLFLRTWLRSRGWAIAGLLLTLQLAMFTYGGDGIKWMWPSSTVMRYVFDVTFLAVLLAHARSGDARLGPVAGGVLALQLLFSTDVGLYLMLASGAYLVCAARRPEPAFGPVPMRRFALGAVFAFLVAALGGFAIANQGALPDGAFWVGWAESLIVFGGGIAHLPIALELGRSAVFDLLLLAILVTYFRTAASALGACIDRSVTQDQAVRATIAVYGMGSLLLFIGRSHHDNLTHVTVPFCLLLASAARSLEPAAGTGRKRWLNVAARNGLSAVLTLAIFVEAAAMGYPNVVDVAVGIGRTVVPDPSWTRRSGDVIPPMSPEMTADFRQVTDALRAASDGGRRSVAVIGADETSYLLEAGIAPYFRYSPVLMSVLYWNQVQALDRRITETPPHWIFVPAKPEEVIWPGTTTDVLAHLKSTVLRAGYLRRGHAGHFDVYEQPGPPATGLLLQ